MKKKPAQKQETKSPALAQPTPATEQAAPAPVPQQALAPQEQPMNAIEVLDDAVSALHVLRSQIKPLGQLAELCRRAISDCVRLSRRVDELEKLLGTGPVKDGAPVAKP